VLVFIYGRKAGTQARLSTVLTVVPDAGAGWGLFFFSKAFGRLGPRSTQCEKSKMMATMQAVLGSGSNVDNNGPSAHYLCEMREAPRKPS
jgi:hypothetical protein